MPNSPKKLSININILKPQGNPEKFYVRISRWALSTGRYIIIFVEIIVLAAFVSRFKFDSDLAETKEKIDQQIPFIENLRIDEQLIRQTQLQLATIKDIRSNSINYTTVIQSIANQTPQGVKINTLNIEKEKSKVTFKISGHSQTNADLASLIVGLRSDNNFSDVGLSSIGLEQSVLTFSISGSIKNINKKDQQS